MNKLILFLLLLISSIVIIGCSSNRGSCIDVTTYDNNRDNDMKCTKSDGTIFYTDYAGAREFESR